MDLYLLLQICYTCFFRYLVSVENFFMLEQQDMVKTSIIHKNEFRKMAEFGKHSVCPKNQSVECLAMMVATNTHFRYHLNNGIYDKIF